MKTRILVIDDDQGHRDILAEALAYYQFKVMVWESGQGLKQVLNSFRPSLLLMDYKLPGENGIELCRKIKGDYNMNDIPIIMMSAYPIDSENLEVCDFILHKPFDLDMLIEHVKELLASHKSGLRENST